MEVIVLTGALSGSRTAIGCDSELVLSDNMEGDLYIRNQELNGESIKIRRDQSNKVCIVPTSNNVFMSEKKLEKDKIVKIVPYQKIKIGSVEIAFSDDAGLSWEKILENVKKLENAVVNSNGTKLLGYSYYIIYISIAVLTAIFITTITVNKAAKTSTEREKLTEILKGSEYQTLSLITNDSGHLIVEGYLNTAAQKADLEKIIDFNGIPAYLNVTVGDLLVSRVEELYRLNGNTVTADYLKEGVVIITANIDEKDNIERIKPLAIDEIEQLVDIDIEYESKVTDDDSNQFVMTGDDQDKRITLVVKGNRPYIITADGSRYYIGSVLPTGHKLIDIKKGQIYVQRAEKITKIDI